MSTTEQRTIIYKNPPLDEIIGGIHFDSIKGLQAGHLGVLWQKFGPDFTSTEDHNLLSPISDDEMNYRSLPPLPRVWFVHKDENELIQMQFNRFIYNWRKRRPDDRYPGYPTFMGNFQEYLSRFQEFLIEQELGDFTPRRYELAYIDHILQHEGWETISDLEKVFPNFIAYKGHTTLPPDIRGINWQIAFGLPNDLGQLNLSIRNAQRTIEKDHLLRVEFRAISNPLHGDMRSWFNDAHDVILDLFSTVISNEIQEKYWGRKS